MSNATVIANAENGALNPEEAVPVGIRTDGLRILKHDVIVDLGERIPELELWATGRSDSGLIVTYFSELKLKFIQNDWALTREATTRIRVEKGFVYDGASLPMLAVVKLIAGEKEKYEVAGLLHDKLYRTQAPRDIADYVFWLVSRSGIQNISERRAWWCWAALRAGGWKAYRANGNKINE